MSGAPFGRAGVGRVGPVFAPAPGHVGRVLGQRREAEPAATFLHRDGVVEVPGHQLAVVVEHELRAVELLAPVVHAHPVVEVGEVHGVGLVEVDGPLEVLERAALEPDVVDGALGDEPGGLLAVVADQAAARPALVVVEDVPEPFAARGGSRAARRGRGARRAGRRRSAGKPVGTPHPRRLGPSLAAPSAVPALFASLRGLQERHNGNRYVFVVLARRP